MPNFSLYGIINIVIWLIKVLSTKYAKQKQPIEAVKRVQPDNVETIGMMQINFTSSNND